MSRIWTCKIGECDDKDLLTPDGKYYGADWPMRQAIQRAYREVTGKEAQFTFSGWAGELTESERAVVRSHDRAGEREDGGDDANLETRAKTGRDGDSTIQCDLASSEGLGD